MAIISTGSEIAWNEIFVFEEKRKRKSSKKVAHAVARVTILRIRMRKLDGS